MALARMFHEGGFTMFWIAWLGMPGLAFAVVHALLAKRWTLITSAILLIVIAGIAVVGTLHGRGKVENAVHMVRSDPELGQRGAELAERIQREGYAEAMRPVQFGAVVIVLGAIPFIAGEVRQRRRAR